MYHITYSTSKGDRQNGRRVGFYAKQATAERGSEDVFFVYAAQILTGGKRKNELTIRENRVYKRSRRLAAVCGAWWERFCFVGTIIFFRNLLNPPAAESRSYICNIASTKARKIALLCASVR